MSTSIDIKEKEYILSHVSDKKLSNGYKYSVPVASTLSLEISGVNNIVVNTLCMVISDYIPVYAFTKELINITANTSVFNNDMMKCRLEQLPLVNIKSDKDLYYLDEKYWNNIDYNDPEREQHPNTRLIDITINAYNDTNNIKTITTNDIRYYEDGEELKHKYHKTAPIVLIQLQPSQSFKCSMRATLGVGARSNIWAGGWAYFDEIKDNKILLTVESSGQYSEYDILIKACKYVKKRLTYMRNEFNKQVEGKTIGEQLTFVFNNEDHTLGNVINDSFQNHPDILFCGLAKPDHMVRSIKITIVSKPNMTPIKPMMEQLVYLEKLYDTIETKISKLSK